MTPIKDCEFQLTKINNGCIYFMEVSFNDPWYRIGSTMYLIGSVLENTQKFSLHSRRQKTSEVTRPVGSTE